MKITINNLNDIFKSKVESIDITERKGYTLIDNLFCDNSGFGSDNEPAYTKSQFEQRIREILATNPTIYTTLTGVGQFQVYVGVYIKTGKSTLTKLAGNTYSYYDNNNVYTIKYHNTDIVKMVDDKITINNGGYYTKTTKERLNTFLFRYDYYIYQKDFQWYIKNAKTNTITEYKHDIILKVQ